MDLLSLAPFLSIFAGIAGVILIALRFQRDDAGAAVERQAKAMDGMDRLNVRQAEEIARLLEHLAAVRSERDRYEAELADANVANGRLRSEKRQLEENLRVCIVEQNRVEARLIELGEDPGHAQV